MDTERESWRLASVETDASWDGELADGHPLASRHCVAEWRRWESSTGRTRCTWRLRWSAYGAATVNEALTARGMSGGGVSA